MGPFAIPNNVPRSTAREIVAEVSKDILEKTAFVLGPQSNPAKIVAEAEKLGWNCRVYKLRDTTMIVVPNTPTGGQS